MYKVEKIIYFEKKKPQIISRPPNRHFKTCYFFTLFSFLWVIFLPSWIWIHIPNADADPSESMRIHAGPDQEQWILRSVRQIFRYVPVVRRGGHSRTSVPNGMKLKATLRGGGGGMRGYLVVRE
jgi:hypothetical protein